MAHPSGVCMTGSLASSQDGLWAELLRRGYTRLSAVSILHVAAHLSRWIEQEGLPPAALSEERIMAFLRDRQQIGCGKYRSRRGLEPILSSLRSAGAIPPHGPPSGDLKPLASLIRSYRSFLVEERGITDGSADRYIIVAEKLLATVGLEDPDALSRLTAAQISGFVVHEARASCVGTAKYAVTALRSFLRYLHLRGFCRDLSAAAPAVAGHRLANLPKGMTEDEVTRLLASCDRTTDVGRRDFAILLLLSRLGLRSIEVARLELDDIDWSRGEMTVRGKGGEGRLPLPEDVGEALVDYLRVVRIRSASRQFFLPIRAPVRPLSTDAVKAVVRKACARSRVSPAGAHRLRHTAATQMLRKGASLAEIAHVLRHRSLMTTVIYAKVDRLALRDLARPWPGGDA